MGGAGKAAAEKAAAGKGSPVRRSRRSGPTAERTGGYDELLPLLPPWGEVMVIVTRRSVRLQRHAVAPALLRPGWRWHGGQWLAPCVANWPPPPKPPPPPPPLLGGPPLQAPIRMPPTPSKEALAAAAAAAAAQAAAAASATAAVTASAQPEEDAGKAAANWNAAEEDATGGEDTVAEADAMQVEAKAAAVPSTKPAQTSAFARAAAAALRSGGEDGRR
jgi:hypothetical protein